VQTEEQTAPHLVTRATDARDDLCCVGKTFDVSMWKASRWKTNMDECLNTR
jgi:hypothetical protein